MNKEADSGIGAKLRAFDFYKKLPQDIAEPTMSGALGTLPPHSSLHRKHCHHAPSLYL